MISKEDRMYFIDPLQPAMIRKTLMNGEPIELQVLVLRYRRDSLKADRIGTIIPVTHQRIENGELWWVDTDGDFLYGAQVVDRIMGRGNVMSIVSDDLFYVGRNGGEHDTGSGTWGTLVTDARRSDGKRIIGNPNATFIHIASHIVRAAPWALDLMPVNGDSDAVVEAKVARAKQMYIQRRKKGEIYKEGMRRDWLHHLETLRGEHDMPSPQFNVGVEGTFLSSLADNVAEADLTQAQRDRLTPVRQNASILPEHGPRNGFVQQFVGAPFSVVTSQTVSEYSQVRSLSTADVRYAVFDALRVHSGHVMESNRFVVLTSF